MTIHNVSNDAELQTAFSASVGGDEIILADGAYATLSINSFKTDYVTIRAANPHQASIADLTFNNTAYFRFEDIVLIEQPRIEGNCHHFWFENVNALAGLYFLRMTDIDVHNCDLGGAAWSNKYADVKCV